MDCIDNDVARTQLKRMKKLESDLRKSGKLSRVTLPHGGVIETTEPKIWEEYASSVMSRMTINHSHKSETEDVELKDLDDIFKSPEIEDNNED